jgi:mRNA-degrading endonuclease RelE of RelBE toxin-antitoxin system
MKVDYSKDFERTVRKLSGKRLESVRDAIREVKKAQKLADITDCIKMQGYDFIYRIHIGSYRAFFNFHVEIKEGIVRFLYLIPRGQAYDKGTKKNLNRNDI